MPLDQMAQAIKDIRHDKRMSMVDHLEELRQRLIWILSTLGIGTVVGWIISPQLRRLLQRPLGNIQLVFFAPSEALMAYIKIGFVFGLFVTAPVMLYHLLGFCLPVTSAIVRRRIKQATAMGTVLFYLGAFFGFWFVCPNMFSYFLSFADASLVPQLGINNYMSLIYGISIVFGLTFELPLVMVLLAQIKVINYWLLKNKRKYIILINALLAGVLTPGPDIISQMLMFVPLTILFEIGVLLIYLMERNERRA